MNNQEPTSVNGVDSAVEAGVGRSLQPLFLRRFVAGMRLPRVSWYALLAAGLMIFIGLYKGIHLLVLLGYLIPVLFVFSARSAARAMPNLAVRRRVLGPLFAGTSADIELHLHNKGPSSCRPVLLENRGREHRFAWTAPALAVNADATLRARFSPARRGQIQAGPLEAVSRYPFGLVEKRVSLVADEEWCIFPRLGQLNREAFQRYLRGHDRRVDRSWTNPRRDPAAREEFHGLRPFRTGDSPRAIHWRTSARRNELMVREYEDFTGENLILIFDPGMPAVVDGWWREQFETAVSFAATLTWEWCRRQGDKFALIYLGTRAKVVTGFTSAELGRRALELLAMSEPAPPEEASNFLAGLGQPTLPSGPAVLVSTRDGHLVGGLQKALLRPVINFGAADLDNLDFFDPPVQVLDD